VSAREKWIAYWTLVVRETLRFSRIWVQTVVPPMVTTALYFIIFGNLIGERVGPMAGHPYRDFIVPGLILMSVITNSYANVVSSFFSAKYQRHVEEMLVAPVPHYVILAGYVTGGVLRGLVVGLAVTGVAALFATVRLHHPGVLAGVALLTAALFSTGGFINAVYARNFDDISIVPTFVLTPLTYLGGVFYSVALLPPFWRELSLFNPILYLVDGFRYAMLGVSDGPPWAAFAIAGAACAASWVFALGLLRRGVGIRS
jgi:ABC-2 type transport system permease protein